MPTSIIQPLPETAEKALIEHLQSFTRAGFATEQRVSLSRLRNALHRGSNVTPAQPATSHSPEDFNHLVEKLARQAFPRSQGYKVEKVREPVGDVTYTYLYISQK